MYRPGARETRETYGILLGHSRRSITVRKGGEVIRVRDGLIGDVVGEEHFKLLRVQLANDVVINGLDRVSLETGMRRKVVRILTTIKYGELLDESMEMLENAVKKIVLMREPEWVEFLNKAGLLTHKVHTLELLPGISRKKVALILEERDSRPFTSFKDFKERVGVDPLDSISKKIVEEMRGEAKKYIFLETQHP